eukprot:TRINITY_DN3162_c0_g1_i2.p1 TRINITY_DN3162_c0_g1~~TRINITY_DN3162_c0_g1_i2.p1  ORF type:complete len:186 (-),score=26.69 TRINITY_DN3162_c0_g1_i2:77-634(-)
MDWVRSLFEVNVFGLVSMTQKFLPLLRQQKGRVVNIGSVAGRLGNPMGATYCGSKFAIEGLSDSLRREVEPLGVAVSLVEPAIVASDILTSKKQTQIDRVYANLKPELEAVYGPRAAKSAAQIAELIPTASSPQVTTDAIVHALTNRYPEPRYVVANVGPMPAFILVRLAWLLPDRLMDAIIEAS